MSRTVNLIPMAGAGKRFSDVGFADPKPLIPVAGTPMVIRAAASLPTADQWIFICRREHLDNSPIRQRLTGQFPASSIVALDALTEGQACTCMTARSLLRPDDALTIGACDNAMVYDTARLAQLMADPAVDALIWTFRHNPAVLQNPRMYGWVRVNDHHDALAVSCKTPISPNPMDDHAVIGAFYFRRAEFFLHAVEALLAQNRRINGEFYVDVAMQVAIEQGLRVKVFEVDHYVCWGTPQDLTLYNYWRDYFLRAGIG